MNPAVLSPADTAHAAAQVYSWSLLATVPLVLACIAAALLFRAPASTRVLVWRGAIASLALLLVSQAMPMRWGAGVLPLEAARPLVLLGRIEVGNEGTRESAMLALVLVAYLAGVLASLASLALGWRDVGRIARESEPLRDAAWLGLVDALRAELGLRVRVRLHVTTRHAVPITWGIFRPQVLVPAHALCWSGAERRALLLHELSHVKAGDVPVRILARVTCALFWFHPLAWVAARELERTSELACDDRVLASGVRQSDYAALLLRAADEARAPQCGFAVSMAAARSGLRGRLAAILTPGRDLRAASRLRVISTIVATLTVSLPLGALRPAPTRQVLTSLMHDRRWDARAYAVIRLAQRADSLALAKAAARLDPSPRVRALASSALAKQGIVPTTLD